MLDSCLSVLTLTVVILDLENVCSLMCRISVSTNNIVESIGYSNVYKHLCEHMKWIRAIYTLL